MRIAFIMMLYALMVILLIVKPAYSSEINIWCVGEVESGNRYDAVSCKGIDYGAGRFQISSVMLEDYNVENGKHINQRDLIDPDINLMICLWAIKKRIPQLLSNYGEEVSTYAILTSYNIGVRKYADGFRNDRYVEKYMNELKKQQVRDMICGK